MEERSFEDMSDAERRHHTMRIMSERCGWPQGVAEKLIAIAEEFPEWHTWWRAAGGPPVSGCVAILQNAVPGVRREIVTDSPEALAEAVRDEDARRREILGQCPTCKRSGWNRMWSI